MTAEIVPDGELPEPATLDPQAFRGLFRQHPAGVSVITLHDGQRPVGFTATSVISVSAEPPILAFSISGGSSSWPALARAERVAVNLLADHQRDLATVFATSGVDRFADTQWHRLATGEPILPGTAAWISGRVLDRIPVGGSYLVTVAATVANATDRPPLIYRDRNYHRLIEYEI